MKKPPNIVVFQTDDHARWGLPMYGDARFAAPNISALADRSLIMDNAFTTTPVCSPARASFFTGLMPSQHGIRDFVSSLPEFHAKDRLAGLDTLPQQLSHAGYFTGLAGKWHLGRDSIPPSGFDEWHAMSGAFPITHQGQHEFSINGDVVQRDGVLTEVITENALDILRARKPEAPLFLYVGYYATHSPWSGHPDHLVPKDEPSEPIGNPPEGYEVLNVELRDATPDLQQAARAQYRAAVAEIDIGVGQILNALPADEDTIIVYTADHGLSLGENGLFGKGNATYPQNLFDDHMRIPMILSRTGNWPTGRSDDLVDLTDLYATLQHAAGITKPEYDGIKRPGRDIVAVTQGTSPAKPFQVSEYGPAVLMHDGTVGYERRPETTKVNAVKDGSLEAFYADLDCQPPWEWQPSDQYLFNPTDAWRPPSGPKSV